MDYNQGVAGNYTHSRVAQAQQSSATAGAPGQNGPALDSNLRGEAPQSATSERKNRRRATKDLHVQARKRREETTRQNFVNPQKPEDQWICEFCEYERIFGYPPVALIRQYEIKDRKLRQQEEERRRVWEKAKARSRKGKKGKAQPKNNANNHANMHNHANDAHQAPPMYNTQSQDTQSDVFDEDEYEGEGEGEGEANYEIDRNQPHIDFEATRRTQSGAARHNNPGGGIGGRGGTGAGAGAVRLEGNHSKG